MMNRPGRILTRFGASRLVPWLHRRGGYGESRGAEGTAAPILRARLQGVPRRLRSATSDGRASPSRLGRRAKAEVERCMQGQMFGAPDPRQEMREDCLYPTSGPRPSAKAKQPVLVSSRRGIRRRLRSEPVRTANGSRGRVVVVEPNRLGVFGFLAHPELTKNQRPRPGNYGARSGRRAGGCAERRRLRRRFGQRDQRGVGGVDVRQRSWPLTRHLVHKAIGRRAFFCPTRGMAEKTVPEGTGRVKFAARSAPLWPAAGEAGGRLLAAVMKTGGWATARRRQLLHAGEGAAVYAAGKQSRIPSSPAGRPRRWGCRSP